MKKIENYENVQANSGEFERPGAGGYVCLITNVEDVPMGADGKGDYLKIQFDIAHGDFAGYYSDLHSKKGFWLGSFVRSYKESALGMFKHFTNCVEETNAGYKWNFEEKSLCGKFIGLVFGEEEYLDKERKVRTRTYVKDIKTTEQIKSGDFKIPELKKLPVDTSVPSGFTQGVNEDLPF